MKTVGCLGFPVAGKLRAFRASFSARQYRLISFRFGWAWRQRSRFSGPNRFFPKLSRHLTWAEKLPN